MINWRFLQLAIIVILVVGGCTASNQARSVQQSQYSGFLGDLYPLMQEGKDGEALLVYNNPNNPPSPSRYYTKILLDPVLIYRGRLARMEGVTQEEAQLAANTFYAMIHEELSKDYEMVSKPGEHTLRMQIAIVKLEQSIPALDVVSSVPAPYNVLGLSSALAKLGTGKALFKGEAAIEAKITDGHTGEIRGATIDRRVGGNDLNAESFDSWADVNAAFRFWAQEARYRLCLSRGEQRCPKPEA